MTAFECSLGPLSAFTDDLTGSLSSFPFAIHCRSRTDLLNCLPYVSPRHPSQSNVNVELGVSTEDIYEDMLQRQGNFVGPQIYNAEAHYLPYRRYLVDWMSDVGEQNHLHNSTIHVAILFMDKIFADPKVKRDKWQLLATACITVAAKYEEAEEHCPIIPDLLKMTKLAGEGSKANVTPLAFRDGEVEVLKHLNWTLRATPALHVVGYYLSKGVVFVDDTWQGRDLIEKIPRYVKKYADFFCNLTMQEYSFQKYLPSQLAAAILMASREALSVAPRWRPEMTALTGYEESEISPIFDHVWKYYGEQFPDRQDPRSISPRGVNQAV